LSELKLDGCELGLYKTWLYSKCNNQRFKLEILIGFKSSIIKHSLLQPHFEASVRMKLKTPKKWELGVLWDSRKLKAWLQGSKHLALRCYLYRWKGLKM
jgi:hypothetical protein